MRQVTVFICIILSCLAWAHDTSISGLKFILDKDGATVAIQSAFSNLTKSGVQAQGLSKELHILVNGKAWICEKPDITVDKPTDTIMLQAHIKGPIESIEIQDRLFSNNPNSKTIVTIMKDGEEAGQGVLSSEFKSWTYTVPKPADEAKSKPSALSAMKDFFLMGVKHILSGPDHLLFIFGLILARPRVKELIKVASGFTVAHSITLTICALGIYTMPAKIVEPLIALSIVAVAAEKFLRPNDKVWRTVAIAFCFGLVHGFGFAGALTEAGLPPERVALSLLSFTVGVELVQISIILTATPLLLWASQAKPKIYRPATVAMAVCISLIGLFWFGERVVHGG